MKKNLRQGLILCVLVIALLFIFSGCGSSADEETTDIQSIDITLSIDFPKKSNIIDIPEVPFRLEEETTILQAIELYGNVNNISVLVDTTHSTLEGISGIINDVHLKGYTWKCKINDKIPSKSVNELILKDGDLVQFIYVKN